MQISSLKLLALSSAAVLLTACASTPDSTPQLAAAQSLYTQAQSDAAINGSSVAQKNLYLAGKTLEKAKTAESEQNMNHYAYLAEQQTREALEMAKRKNAEQQIEKLSKEKTEVVMEAREKDIIRAQAEVEAKKREAEQALARVQQLEKQLNDLEAKQTDRGLVLTLGDVLFETGKATLLGGAMRNLDKLAQFLTANPEKMIQIEGHTDSIGSESFNLELSRNRAASVRDALQSRGISSTRMHTQGFGKSRPVAGNDTHSGRQQNRRVEIIILK